MFDMILKHQFGAAVAAYWILSAAVSSLPTPSAGSSALYLWTYRFLHTIAGNLTTAFGSKVPGATIALAVLAALLVLPIPGCAPHYTVHPGSLSTGDSTAYDALLIAQGTIDQAKMALAAGQLPSSAKDPLNTLIRSYNVAHTSWLTYRGALATNQPSDQYLQQLTQNLTDLTTAIRAFQQQEQQQ